MTDAAETPDVENREGGRGEENREGNRLDREAGSTHQARKWERGTWNPTDFERS